jgi:hypothetical protein
MVLSSFSGVLSRLRNTDQNCSSGKLCRWKKFAGRADVPDDV